MVTTLGIVFGAVVLVVLLAGRGMGVPLALGIAVPAGAALALGDNSVPVFFAVAVPALVGIPFQKATTGRPLRWLYGFAAWAIVITVLGPVIFHGTPVLPGRAGIDLAYLSPQPLQYTVSNVAQVGYLVLGVGVVVYLTRTSTARASVAMWGLGGGVVLSFAKLAADRFALPWPDGFFDNSTNFRYIDTAVGGAARFRGIFPEPSGLATHCLVAIAFLVPLALRRRRWVRWLAVALVVMAVALLAVSTATTALVSGAAIAAAAAVWWAIRFGTGRITLRPEVALVGLVVIAVAVLLGLGPVLDAFAGVQAKLSSASFFSRSGADLFSLGLIDDSAGLGVGLGSNRPSSFVAMLLSCLGLPGLVLFVAAVAAIIRRAWRQPEARPVVYALVALLLSKSLVGSDLNTPALWLLLGLCARYAATEPPAAERAPVAARSDARA